MNLLLLHLFVRAAHDRLVGATLGAPAWYRPVLVLPFSPAGERRATYHLVAVLETPGPFVYVAADRPFEGARAPERFAALTGRRVAGVSPVAGDRVLVLDVEGAPQGASGPLSLSLHLYGSQGGALLERGDTVLESVGARRRSGPRDRRRRSLVEIDERALDAAMSLTTTDGAHAPQELVPGVDRTLAEVFTVGDGELDAPGLIAFRDALVRGGVDFRLLAPGKLGAAVPVPAGGHAGAEGKAFGPFVSAFDACAALGDTILGEVKRRMLHALAQPLRKKLAAQRKLAGNLRDDLERARGHGRVRREAEVLAAYQSTIRPGAESVELPDIYDEAQTVRISLDPATPLQKQIDKRFKRAAKLERSEAHAAKRLELVGAEIVELDAALRLLDASESFAQALVRLEALCAKFDVDRARGPLPVDRRRPQPPQDAGRRRYDLGDGWYALVGRNNKDNDELTFRHAAPTDLWLHAQGVPGSHVILKTSRPSGSPPASVVERAASLAAHFSKARHSGLVPVIYTQRKYVRKFRGAKPGQVVCEREKMVMVEPRLPENNSV
jgi:predicted ribosome quality control (RQC) complex YloA/Tae2 family protein